MSEHPTTSTDTQPTGADALFNLDLIRKYNKAGPRYTSYPTAPMFHEGIGATDYAESLKRVSTSQAAPSSSSETGSPKAIHCAKPIWRP